MMVISCHMPHINHHTHFHFLSKYPKPRNTETIPRSFFGILLVEYFCKSRRTKHKEKMESISIGRKEFGLIVGVFTAMFAVLALLAGKRHARGNNAVRYEGWYDSLGI